MAATEETMFNIDGVDDGKNHQPKTAETKKQAEQKKPNLIALIPKESRYISIDQSTVVILISISSKNIMKGKNFQAFAAYLVKKNAKKVIVLVGGHLKRHNFWEHPDYEAQLDNNKVPEIPSEEAMIKFAAEQEKAWMQDEENSKTLAFLEAKLGTRYELLPWNKFIQSKNYIEVFNTLKKHYDSTSGEHFRIEVNKTANSHLLKSIEKIHAIHKKIAREHNTQYLLEEGPVHARSLLPAEYLCYQDEMNAAMIAFNQILNPTNPVKRWVPPKFVKTNAYEDPIYEGGHSSTVDNFIPAPSPSPSPSPTESPRSKFKEGDNSFTTPKAPPTSPAGIAIPRLPNKSNSNSKSTSPRDVSGSVESSDGEFLPKTLGSTYPSPSVTPYASTPKYLEKDKDKIRADQQQSGGHSPTTYSSAIVYSWDNLKNVNNTTKAKSPISPRLIPPVQTGLAIPQHHRKTSLDSTRMILKTKSAYSSPVDTSTPTSPGGGNAVLLQYPNALKGGVIGVKAPLHQRPSSAQNPPSS